jgi:hypothetical protein
MSKQIIFTPKWENGKEAFRHPKKGEWFFNGGFILWMSDSMAMTLFPIYTRTEVEIPDPEPIGWKLMRTGEVRTVKNGEWCDMHGELTRWNLSYSTSEYPILSCTPIYEGDV